MTDIKVKIAGKEFKNPVTVASGTFGSGREYSEFIELSKLGAVTTKGVSSVPWEGNPTPRIAEVYGGMLNAIGLQNPGVDVFIERDLPFLEQQNTGIIVNICGKTIEDYIEVVERLSESSVDMFEINISCPNVKEGGIAFGQSPDLIKEITSTLKSRSKKPIIMKLSPNVTDINVMARAAQEAGADAISLINTITGKKLKKGELPLEKGVIVSNVSTVKAIYDAFFEGKPLIERIVTISGEEAKNIGNYKIKFGTPLYHVVKELGIPNEDKVIFGGPMMEQKFLILECQ